MPVKNLTQVTCVTGLLLGKLASAGAAQTIEWETNLSAVTGKETDRPPAHTSNDNELNLDTHNQTNSLARVAAPETPPKTFSESNPSLNTQDQTNFLATLTEPETLITLETALALDNSLLPANKEVTKAEKPVPTVLDGNSRDAQAQKSTGETFTHDQTAQLKTQQINHQQRDALDAKTEARFLSQSAEEEKIEEENTTPQPESPNTAPTPETAETFPKFSPRLGVDFTTGEGVGYSSSFSSFGGFVPLSQTPGRNLTFLEGRLALSTEGSNVGGNLVLGHRFFNPKHNRIYGGYVAYDHRSTGESSFNQLGLGLETLGKSWDARANLYIPFGDNRQLTQGTTTVSSVALSEPFFQGNFLAQATSQQQLIKRRYEAAMTGVDVEAGGKIAQLGRTGDLRGYGGLYFYDAPGSDQILGWRTRLEARPTDNFRLGLALSSDATFGTNLVFSVGANFPGIRPRRTNQKDSVVARLGEPTTRNVNIVVDEQTESELLSNVLETIYLTNPETGQPWVFRHVNLGIGTGDGTFENPTGTVAAALAVAEPNNIVYVQPGTNPGIPAFTIPDGVQVLSTGPIQLIDTVELATIQLPLSGAGVFPTVNGTVTLGNDTTLSGFAINAVPGAGIIGSNISNVIVRDNRITNLAGEGILLNDVNGEVTVIRNTIDRAGLEGFSLNNNQGQVQLQLTENQITSNGASAADGDGVNIDLRNTAGGTFNIANNTIANNSSAGVLADGVDVKLFDAASGTFNLANNQITQNQLNGINIALESTAQGTFNFAQNNLSNNQLSGVAVLFSDEAQGTFNLNSNTISNNLLKGTQFIFSERTTGNISLTSNAITGNQDDGVYIQSSDQAQWTANLTSNTITNNQKYGIFTTTNGASQFRVLIDSNNVSNNAFAGVSLNTFDSANSSAALLSNTITGNSLGGLEVFTVETGSACLQPRNNTINSLLLDDSFGGPIQVETGTLPTNNISSSDLTFWSGTTVPAGSCGF